MGYLDNAVDIQELGQSNLIIIYGKSGTGKTHLLATCPKPILYVQIGDDGSNTISNVKGVKAVRVDNVDQLKAVLLEARLDKTYKTVAVDTFSLIVEEWIDANATQKKKRVTIQMWGDIKSETAELVKLAHILARDKVVVLTCHEATDTIEGFEDEIAPDVRPSVSKGARTYLEGMANYGLHTTILEKEKPMPDGTTKTVMVHAVHLASSPYYWVKTQKPAGIKLPKMIYNPSYNKIMRLMRGDK